MANPNNSEIQMTYAALPRPPHLPPVGIDEVRLSNSEIFWYIAAILLSVGITSNSSGTESGLGECA